MIDRSTCLNWWMAAFASLSSVAIHMIIPAMPVIAAELHTTAARVQGSLTLYLGCAAAGQFIAARLSESLGRRPILLGGICLYATGAMVCAFADSVILLLCGRCIQGVGASAGVVISRAAAADRGGTDAINALAILTAIVMCAPMVAPLLGVAITAALGWRAMFGLLAAGSILCIAPICRLMPQSSIQEGQLSSMAASLAILRDRDFLPNLIVGCAISVAGLFFLATSPFLLSQQHGVSSAATALFYATIAAAAVVGALTVQYLSARPAPYPTVKIGRVLLMSSSLLLLAAPLIGFSSIIAFWLPMLFFSFGNGMLAPVILMQAVKSQAGQSATAISLYGACQMAFSSLMASLLGGPFGQDSLGFGGVMFSSALVVEIISRVMARRRKNQS